ncbi:hypothetical protein HFP89_08605 [Wenzhouxiangella sp. XN79A]|uniref:ankyrin repeat domain-containing protein n=1 Tax=Wenzhouxiangella sp. XN79A TaxID=2724193 RepID=UPI00144A7B22|nr:ankyrin repeat domain-containing protein [Wenzhouxiangella sp. XN79A]NKI35225.1 hypothetical protein [Wenzhouxiangella sp. XN79A]
MIDKREIYSGPGGRRLVDAIERNDCSGIAEVINSGTPIDIIGAASVTPIFLALRQGRLKSWQCLLSLGADPDQRVASVPLIHHAAIRQDIRFLETLLDSGAEPNVRSGPQGKTPLFVARAVGLEHVRVLVQAGANPDMKLTQLFQDSLYPVYDQSPIYEAASLGDLDIVEYYLSLGVDVCGTNSLGETISDILDRLYVQSLEQEQVMLLRNLKLDLKEQMEDC